VPCFQARKRLILRQSRTLLREVKALLGPGRIVLGTCTDIAGRITRTHIGQAPALICKGPPINC